MKPLLRLLVALSCVLMTTTPLAQSLSRLEVHHLQGASIDSNDIDLFFGFPWGKTGRILRRPRRGGSSAAQPRLADQIPGAR